MSESSSSGVVRSAAADPLITVGVSLGVLAAVALSYHLVRPAQGNRKWVAQVIYWVIAGLIIAFLPFSVGRFIFSSLTVTFVGTVFPIYESIRAVCTPEEDDDKEWLQYWIFGGVLFMLTTWVDDVIQTETGDEYWYEAMSFLFYWLYFPKTHGARLFYDHVTEPYLAPRVRPLAAKMTNMISYLYQTLINAVHLWILWIIFMFLPAGLKRIIAIAIGTVYPFVSSVTAAATEEIDDDTYWLTYWSVYGCLFLIMDLLETWLGWIPGFYTLVIFATVYLMLPMFGGADKLFRKILVPLSGLQELLMLRDAITVKKTMLKDLDPERAKVVRKTIARYYDDDNDLVDPAAMKDELMSSWEGMKMPRTTLPSFRNPFSSTSTSTSAEGEPNETTPIV